MSEFDDAPDLVPSTPDAPKSPFSDAPVAKSRVSFGEAASEFAKGAVGGVAEMSGAVAGMMAGGALGTMGGPAAPVTVPVGAALGLVTGYWAGHHARRGTIGTVEDVRPEARPYAVAGETTGGAVPFIGAPIIAGEMGAKMAPTLVGRFINRITESAAAHPVRFATMEGSAALAAGAAGAAAESYTPGNAWTRAGAEIAAGLTNPVRTIMKISEGASYGIRHVIQSFSESGRQTAAAKVLQELVELSGEDPVKLARLLRDSGIPGVGVSSAQKTGSPALAAIERKLTQHSAKFGAEMEDAAQEGLDNINAAVVALRATGDPAAFRAALRLRDNYFRALLDGRVKIAEERALEAASKITQDTPSARAELSRVSREALGSALSESRAVERELLGKIDQETVTTVGNTIGRYTSLRNEHLLPEESLPAVVEGFIKRIGKTGTASVKDLLRFRDRALVLADQIGSDPTRATEAEVLGMMAEAVLDDINVLADPTKIMGAGSRIAKNAVKNQRAIEEALTFSNALNDTFTRSFAGRAVATTPLGGARIPPELMMRKALATGKEAGDLQLRELEQATRFLETQGFEGSQVNAEIMMDAQERLIRLAAAESIDPLTGRVNVQQLAKFAHNNDNLLGRFPEAKAAIQEAITSEQALRQTQRLISGESRVLEQQRFFSRASGIENPVDAIQGVVGGNQPVAQLKAMAKAAKEFDVRQPPGTPSAVEGLKTVVIDHALRQGGVEFNPVAVKKALFDPVRPGQPSLSDLMRKAGVLSADDVSQLTKLLDQADTIQKALTTGQHLDELVRDPNAFFDLMVRVAGSSIATRAAAGTGGAGHGLIVARAGSQYAQRLFERIPKAQLQTVLMEAARNPRFAALLLEKPKGASDALRLTRSIHAYLIGAGVRMTGGEGEGRGQSNTPPFQSSAAGGNSLLQMAAAPPQFPPQEDASGGSQMPIKGRPPKQGLDYLRDPPMLQALKDPRTFQFLTQFVKEQAPISGDWESLKRSQERGQEMADALKEGDYGAALSRFFESVAEGVAVLPAIPSMIHAYHGTHAPDIKKFSSGFIGTGEGTQAFGYGLYFAENPGVAGSYRPQPHHYNAEDMIPLKGGGQLPYWLIEELNLAKESGPDMLKQVINNQRNNLMEDALSNPSKLKSISETRDILKAIGEGKVEIPDRPGRLYNVRLDVEHEDLLDWDLPLSKQPPKVQKALEPILKDFDLGPDATGEDLVRALEDASDPKLAAETLKEAGIPGVRYLDAGSRPPDSDLDQLFEELSVYFKGRDVFQVKLSTGEVVEDTGDLILMKGVLDGDELKKFAKEALEQPRTFSGPEGQQVPMHPNRNYDVLEKLANDPGTPSAIIEDAEKEFDDFSRRIGEFESKNDYEGLSNELNAFTKSKTVKDLDEESREEAVQMINETAQYIRDMTSGNVTRNIVLYDDRLVHVVDEAGNAIEMVREPAIKYKSHVYTGQTHGDIANDLEDKFGEDFDWNKVQDGFVTSEGRFVDRREAAALAKTAKQVQEGADPKGLMSEDLDPELMERAGSDLRREVQPIKKDGKIKPKGEQK